MKIIDTFNFEIFGVLESITVIFKNGHYDLLDASDQYVPGFAGFSELENLLAAVNVCFGV